MKKRTPKIVKRIRARERTLGKKAGSNSLTCPECGHGRSYISDTRRTNDNSVRRRHICGKCEHRFTGYEIRSDEYEMLEKLARFCRELLPLMPAIEKMASER